MSETEKAIVNQAASKATIEPAISTQGNFSAGFQTVNLDAEGYAKFQAWIADSKRRNIADILQSMKGSNGVNSRRQTMVLRRVDQKALVPDEDVAAYQRIYDLKNPSGDSKNKTVVTDNEIKAYKVLDPRFDTIPSLTTIAAKVEELKATGHLTAEGDKVEED